MLSSPFILCFLLFSLLLLFLSPSASASHPASGHPAAGPTDRRYGLPQRFHASLALSIGLDAPDLPVSVPLSPALSGSHQNDQEQPNQNRQQHKSEPPELKAPPQRPKTHQEPTAQTPVVPRPMPVKRGQSPSQQERPQPQQPDWNEQKAKRIPKPPRDAYIPHLDLYAIRDEFATQQKTLPGHSMKLPVFKLLFNQRWHGHG
jgi:hypothetical protein